MRKLHHPTHPIIWTLFFSLFGFGLRLHRLDFQPLWGDEGWSFYFAMQPPGRLLALTAGDIHPPLYYLVLKIWLAFGGVEAEMARFLSIVVGTLLIPTLYVLGRRLFEKRVGVMAAAVVALAPLAIYYSQEVRMYGLATLLGALSVYYFVQWQTPRSHFAGRPNAGNAIPAGRRRRQTAYVLTTTAALYTHYYAALILFFQMGFVLLRLVRKRSLVSIKRAGSALTPFLLIGLLYLPWALYIGFRLPGYVENKRTLDADLPLNFIRFFGDHFVAFSVGHLSPTLQQYVWGALPFIGVASLGFIAALYFNQRKPYLYLFLYLFTPLLIGYLINQIFPFNPPYFERTLLLAAPAYWLFIAAGLIWLWDRHYLLVGTVVLAMLLATGVVLTDFYATPRYPHEDYRPLLKKIAAQATPEDTLLASYQWQLGFYQAYLPTPRPRLFTVPGWGEGWAGQAGQARLQRDLSRIFETSPRLWFPAYQLLGRLWEDETEIVINRMGYPALLEWRYGPQTKLTLTGSPNVALEAGPTANFEGRLRLLESQVGHESYEAGRGIIPVALTWRKMKSLGSEHQVSLRLTDIEGRTWAVRDAHPQGGRAFFTDLAIGERLADRHGLLIPAGTPPGVYRLLLSIRRVSDAHPLDLIDEAGQPLGAELFLGEATVIDPIRPVGPAALPVQTAAEAVFGDQARLVGYSLGQEPFKAGQSMPLTLFWQSLADQPAPLTVLIALRHPSGQTMVSHQREPIRPTSTWSRGVLLRDPQDVLLPPKLPAGTYQVTAALATPEQTLLPVGGDEWLHLTTVVTVDRPHIFAPPTPQIDMAVTFGDQARLVGLDLPQTRVKGGQGLPLTLYWQGLKPFDTSWSVFVHLVDAEGQIVAQQDQIPGGGQFPTTSWLPDEYLTDSYNLSIPADAAPGENAYQLRIGLYNAAGRLPVLESGKIIGDHVALKDWQISVE